MSLKRVLRTFTRAIGIVIDGEDGDYDPQQSEVDGEILRSQHNDELQAIVSQPEFTGREWLRDWMQKQEEKQENYIVLTAPPGTGKTTFLRDWVNRKLQDNEFLRDNRVVYYEIIPGKDNINTALGGVCKQLQKQFVLAEIAEDEDKLPWLGESLIAASAQLKNEGKLYLYIDSIDSVGADQDQLRYRIRPLLQNLPDKVVVTLTSRPREETWGASVQLDLIDDYRAENEADIAVYVRERMQKEFPASADQNNRETFVSEVTAHSQGCFAYASHLLRNRTEFQPFLEKPQTLPSLPSGFDEYINGLWERMVIQLDAKQLPEPIFLGVLGIIAQSHRPLTPAQVQQVLSQAIDDFSFPCFGLTRGVKKYTVEDAWHRVDDCLNIASEFFVDNEEDVERQEVQDGEAQDSSRDNPDEIQFFHNAFRDFVMAKLERRPSELGYCQLFVANFWSSEVKRFVYDDFQSVYTLEHPDFHQAVADMVEASTGVADIRRRREEAYTVGYYRYVVPVAWYLYGHFWWDEFDPSFPLCQQIIDKMEKASSHYRDAYGHEPEIYKHTVQSLKWMRENWPRQSVWTFRRESCAGLREAFREKWEEALFHLNRLQRELHLSEETFTKDKRLMGIDEYSAALAIIMNFKAECALAVGDFDTAESLYNASFPLHKNVDFLDWCVPYALNELADTLLDKRDIAGAIESINQSFELLVDNIGTDDEDNLGFSEAYRFYADVLWETQDKATEAALILSLYHLWIGHNDADSFADAYCIGFHKETVWSVMDRVSEWYRSPQNRPRARAFVRTLRQFWEPYFTTMGQPSAELTDAEIDTVLEQIPRAVTYNDAVNNTVYEQVNQLCGNWCLPIAPTVGDEDYEKHLEELIDSGVFKEAVEQYHQTVKSAMGKRITMP